MIPNPKSPIEKRVQFIQSLLKELIVTKSKKEQHLCLAASIENEDFGTNNKQQHKYFKPSSLLAFTSELLPLFEGNNTKFRFNLAFRTHEICSTSLLTSLLYQLHGKQSQHVEFFVRCFNFNCMLPEEGILYWFQQHLKSNRFLFFKCDNTFQNAYSLIELLKQVCIFSYNNKQDNFERIAKF